MKSLQGIFIQFKVKRGIGVVVLGPDFYPSIYLLSGKPRALQPNSMSIIIHVQPNEQQYINQVGGDCDLWQKTTTKQILRKERKESPKVLLCPNISVH